MALAVSGTRVVVEYATGTSLAITAGTRAAGDGLLVTAWTEANKTQSAPAGYTQLAAVPRSGSFQENVYGRIATNTSADNFSTSWTGSTGRFGEMRRITGGPAEVAKWLVGTSKNGSSTTIAWEAVAEAPTGSLAVGVWDTSEAVTPGSVTSGWTKDGATWTPVITKAISSKESTGAPTLAISPTKPWISVMVVVTLPEEEPAATPKLAMIL